MLGSKWKVCPPTHDLTSLKGAFCPKHAEMSQRTKQLSFLRGLLDKVIRFLFSILSYLCKSFYPLSFKMKKGSEKVHKSIAEAWKIKEALRKT